MINQLSIYAENTKGAMNKITNVLKDGNLSIQSLLTNDSGEFGVIRLLVNDPEKAYDLFIKEGYMCRMDKVIGIYMQEKVGGLNDILEGITASNVNVDYIYISFDRESAAPIAVMHVEGYEEVEMSLKSKGYKLL